MHYSMTKPRSINMEEIISVYTSKLDRDFILVNYKFVSNHKNEMPLTVCGKTKAMF